MGKNLVTGDIVWLIVRSDEPSHGDYCTSERRAALKVAWLKRQNVEAKAVRAVVQVAGGESP